METFLDKIEKKSNATQEVEEPEEEEVVTTTAGLKESVAVNGGGAKNNAQSEGQVADSTVKMNDLKEKLVTLNQEKDEKREKKQTTTAEESKVQTSGEPKVSQLKKPTEEQPQQ